jgi:hypothetical protein
VWNIDWSGTPIQLNLPDLNPLRSLANLLSSDAFIAHTRGDDDTALLDLLNERHEADATEQYYPSLVSHMVAVGINSLASDGTLRLSRVVHLSSSSQRQTAQRLIASLLGDRAVIQGAQTCWFGERQLSLYMTTGLPGPPGPPGRVPTAIYFCIRPLLIADAPRALEIQFQTQDALKEPTWPAAKAKLPDYAALHEGGAIYQITHLVTMLTPSYDRFCETQYRGLAERRVAALAMAIALYRSDHNGNWPETLDELAPNYIAPVPIDPFSPSASPMRYSPNAPGGPIIYSVGENGIDDGGSEQVLDPTNKHQPPSPWDRLDGTFHLTAQPKPDEAPQ